MTDNFEIKDSGQRREYGTGMVRDTNDGKPDYGLRSPYAQERVAAHLTKGIKKYGRRNWEKGAPVSDFYASVQRHLKAYEKGDRSEDHLAAAQFGLDAIMHFEELAKLGVNLENGNPALDLLDEYASYQLAIELRAEQLKAMSIEEFEAGVSTLTEFLDAIRKLGESVAGYSQGGFVDFSPKFRETPQNFAKDALDLAAEEDQAAEEAQAYEDYVTAVGEDYDSYIQRKERELDDYLDQWENEECNCADCQAARERDLGISDYDFENDDDEDWHGGSILWIWD